MLFKNMVQSGLMFQLYGNGYHSDIGKQMIRRDIPELVNKYYENDIIKTIITHHSDIIELFDVQNRFGIGNPDKIQFYMGPLFVKYIIQKGFSREQPNIVMIKKNPTETETTKTKKSPTGKDKIKIRHEHLENSNKSKEAKNNPKIPSRLDEMTLEKEIENQKSDGYTEKVEPKEINHGDSMEVSNKDNELWNVIYNMDSITINEEEVPNNKLDYKLYNINISYMDSGFKKEKNWKRWDYQLTFLLKTLEDELQSFHKHIKSIQQEYDRSLYIDGHTSERPIKTYLKKLFKKARHYKEIAIELYWFLDDTKIISTDDASDHILKFLRKMKRTNAEDPH